MARSSNVGDDILKALAKEVKKMMNSKPLSKVRYDLQKNLPKVESRPQSRIVDKPKKATDIPSQSWMGGKTTKGPKSKPKRSKTPSLKGREQAKTAAEQREAERRANRLLRMNSEPKPKVVRDSKTGVSDVIPTVPKRSKSRPVGRSWEHEADMARRQQAADAKAMGRGQKPKGGAPKVHKPKPAPKPKGPKK